jgi:HlyD family secretion protein
VNVNVSIITARDQNAVIVPREAVYQEDGQRFIYQVVDGRLVRQNVKTSISNLTQIEVTQGLSDGATIAISSTNGQPLQAGMAVRSE